MGDVFENREAEQLVHGRIHRLQPDHESPQLDLGDVGEPVQRFTIATSALATPQEFGWHGYELELAVDSTPGVAVGVAFSRADADAGRVQRLYPGERFSSARPFRRVWIVSVGGAGSAVLHLTRVSLATRTAVPFVPYRAAFASYVGTPAVGDILCDSGALAAGIYDVSVWLSANLNAYWGYYYQHRNAANSLNLFDPVFEYQSIPPHHAVPYAYKGAPFSESERFRVVCAEVGALSTVCAQLTVMRVG